MLMLSGHGTFATGLAHSVPGMRRFLVMVVSEPPPMTTREWPTPPRPGIGVVVVVVVVVVVTVLVVRRSGVPVSSKVSQLSLVCGRLMLYFEKKK